MMAQAYCSYTIAGQRSSGCPSVVNCATSSTWLLLAITTDR